MMLGEPAPTSYDLYFQLGRIPVRVHPLFWLAGVLLGSGGFRDTGLGAEIGILLVLVWVFVFFFSILIHEMGHALTMQYYGLQPRVLLYMLGGLAIADSHHGFGGYTSKANDPRTQIIIAFAGPAAGFLFAALLFVILHLTGVPIEFHTRSIYFWSVDWAPLFESAGDERNRKIMAMFLVHGFSSALYVNIFWGMINLMPVYPLDGGQISRHLFSMQDPVGGIVKSLWLSLFAGVALCIFGLTRQNLLMAMMFGSLAFSSYNAIQLYTGRGGYGGGRPW